MNVKFGDLSDREIAAHLYKTYGHKLIYYAVKSWHLDEDEVWEILYDTLYAFINAYAHHNFAVENQVGALLWTIFKNKLRDRLRQKKREEKEYQEISWPDNLWYQFTDVSASGWPQENDTISSQNGGKYNSTVLKLEEILDRLKDWERQLLLCRANDIPYKFIEEMTGKGQDFLKVHYQRLKKRVAEKLKVKFISIGEKNDPKNRE